MGDHNISPKYLASKISPGAFSDWVDVFEDRWWGWHFAHAASLAKENQDAQFVVLSLALAFIEAYEVYRTGQDSDGKSQAFFKAGFKRIFPNFSPPVSAAELDEIAVDIYKQIRCGLFHQGATRHKVFIYPNKSPLEVQRDSTGAIVQINIDSNKFLDAVVNEFRTYVARLRNAADPEWKQIKQSFENAWHLLHAK